MRKLAPSFTLRGVLHFGAPPGVLEGMLSSEEDVLAFLRKHDPDYPWEVETTYRLPPDARPGCGDDYMVAGYLITGGALVRFLPDGISESAAVDALVEGDYPWRCFLK